MKTRRGPVGCFGIRRAGLVLFLLAVATRHPASGAEESGYRGVSRPAGFVAVDFPAGSLVLAGMPLHPFSRDIDSWLGWQLSGGPDKAGAETLMFRDESLGQYITLYRMEDGADEAIEGHWVFDGPGGPEPVEVPVEAGDGFWVRSRSAVPRRLFLAGEVPVEGEYVHEVGPGLHVLASPYPQSCGIAQLVPPEDIGTGDRLTLWDPLASRYEIRTGAAGPGSGQGSGQGQWRTEGGGGARATRLLASGEGFLLDRLAGNPFTLRVSRPYAAPFARGEILPRIESIDVIDSEGEDSGALLRIRVDPARSRTLHILYQDPPNGGGFDAYGWREADRIALGGGSEVEWTDDDDHSRPAAARVPARFYLVVCGDTDSDGDGLADGLEGFIHRTSPYRADSNGDGIPDGWLVRRGLDPLDPGVAQANPSGDGIGNLSKYCRGLDPRVAYRRAAVGLRVASPLER